MFESFLEKLIINNFGQYISGLDRNKLHLAIWSGNIVIEDVNIKPDILEALNLPISLLFSTIGKLQLQIPWSSLSKTPVEIILDKILIIVIPKNKSEWKFQDYSSVSRKMKLLNDFAKSCFASFIEKQKLLASSKKKDEKDGFLDKLSMKVLDNLQLTIKNIHVRFEDESSHCSFGVTLDEIIMVTTDETWTKSFIDRTEEKNKEKPMNKLLRLRNLGVYWNSRETSFLSSLEKFVIIEKLNRMILKEQTSGLGLGSSGGLEYIINISAEAKLIQNCPTNFELPEYKFSIDLKAIELHLRNEQFEQLIRSFETYIQYNKLQMIERKKLLLITEEQKLQYNEDFLRLFPFIQKSETKTLEILDIKDQELFKNILNCIGSEELCLWAKKSLKEIQRSLKVQELEKLKKKTDSSWFKWGNASDAKLMNTEISPAEYQEIEDFIEKSFGTETEEIVSQTKKLIRPIEKPWLELGFCLEGGSIYLSKKNQNNDQEGIKLRWHGFLLHLFNYSNGGTKLQVQLAEIGIDMITEYVGNKTPIVTQVLYKGSKVSRQNFLTFCYEKNPIGRVEDQAFSCIVDSIELVYHPMAFYRLFGFFDVKTKDEAFKTAAWEQIEKLSDISHERVQDILSNSLKLKLDLQIDAPVIIIPFKHNNDLGSECWIIDLGFFLLRSNDEISAEKQFYEIFRLKLAEMKMQYVPKRKLIPSTLSKYQRKSLKYLEEESKGSVFSLPDANFENNDPNDFTKNKDQKDFKIEEDNPSLEEGYGKVFNVIEEYTIDIEIHKLKTGLLKDPIRLQEKLPAIKLNIELPKFQILLNKTIYKSLINLPDTLHFSDITNLELLQNEKLALLNSEIKSGSLKRRGNTYKSWKNYFVIFSGGYLYFFNNQKDLSPLFSIYIKKAIIKISTEEGLGFVILTKNEECFLACENQQDLNDWVQVLQQKIEDFSLKMSEDIPLYKKKHNSISGALPQSLNDQSLLEIALETRFHIKALDLSIYEDYEYKPWISCSLRNFHCVFQQKKLDFELDCGVESLLIQDSVFEYYCKEFQRLVFTQSKGLVKESLRIKLKSVEQKHPEYNNLDLDLKMTCQNLSVNWKPGTLLKLGEYIKILKDYQRSKAEAKIITNPLDQGVGYLKSNEELKEKYPTGIQGSKLLRFSDYKNDKEKVLFRAIFEIEEITINFLHKQTYACLAQGQLSKVIIDLDIKDVMFQIGGRLSNIQIFDMTNYPKTNHTNEKQYKEIRPYELFGLSGENPGLKLQIISFENSYKGISGNLTTLFSLEVSAVLFKYHHQLLMRIVDYALIQVVSLITDPKYLTLNEEFYQENGDSKVFEPKKFVGEDEEVLQRLNYPSFLYIRISFEQPVILLKPTPSSEDYIELIMSKVFVESDQYNNKSRLIEKKPVEEFPEVWCENYRIEALDLHIYLNKKGEKKTELAIPVLLNLSVEKILMSEEILWLLGKKGIQKTVSLNNNYIIKGLLSPIILKLYRDEYLFILKMLFHNITFDDFRDKWFIYDFDIVSHYEPTPITFQLDFLNITLFAMHSKTNMPFSSISMQNMRLKWVRDKQFNVDVYVFGQGFSSNYFTSYNNELIEKGFIGNIGKYEEYEVGNAGANTRTYDFDINKQIYKRYLLESLLGSNVQTQEFEIGNLNEEKVEFSLKVLMTPRGEKSIIVVFSDVKLLAQTSVYMNLFYFAQLDDSVYPSIDCKKFSDII